MTTKKKTTAPAADPTPAERATLADHCNRVAHHLRRDLGERPGFPKGGPDPVFALVAKAVDACATDFIRTGAPGEDDAVNRVIEQLETLDDQQATDLAAALAA